MSAKAKEQAPRAYPRHRRPRRAKNDGFIQIGMRLPLATLRMLDAEAGRRGWARSQFLDALVWHKLGQGVRLEHMPGAPREYRFTESDWTTTERWIWYASPATKRRLDELRLRMGNIKPAAWIAVTMTHWLDAASSRPG